MPAFLWSWLATVLLLLLLLTALLSLEGVSLVDGLLPSEAGSEYMGGGGCRLKDKFDRKLIRFSTKIIKGFLLTGPPRQGRQGRIGPSLDFGIP